MSIISLQHAYPCQTTSDFFSSTTITCDSSDTLCKCVANSIVRIPPLTPVAVSVGRVWMKARLRVAPEFVPEDFSVSERRYDGISKFGCKEFLPPRIMNRLFNKTSIEMLYNLSMDNPGSRYQPLRICKNASTTYAIDHAAKERQSISTELHSIRLT
jgi:hypothetical protein